MLCQPSPEWLSFFNMNVSKLLQKFEFGVKYFLKSVLDTLLTFSLFATLEQIWRNLALHHLLTNGSSAVNGCRQNKSPKTKVRTY